MGNSFKNLAKMFALLIISLLIVGCVWYFVIIPKVAGTSGMTEEQKLTMYHDQGIADGRNNTDPSPFLDARRSQVNAFTSEDQYKKLIAEDEAYGNGWSTGYNKYLNKCMTTNLVDVKQNQTEAILYETRKAGFADGYNNTPPDNFVHEQDLLLQNATLELGADGTSKRELIHAKITNYMDGWSEGCRTRIAREIQDREEKANLTLKEIGGNG